MGKYKSQWTGPQIDEGVGAARNPDTTPTADSDALITSDAVAKVQQGFAPIENDATASQAYAIGDLLVWGGILYKAKTAIAVNDSFTVGTNIEATTIADKLNNIDTEITSNTDTTLTGVLIGNGSKVGTKSLDTSSLTNDADHVPVSSVVKSALTHDIANIVATGATNTTGAIISRWTYFYLDGALVQAKENIGIGAPFTNGTNYKAVTAGGLNDAISQLTQRTLLADNESIPNGSANVSLSDSFLNYRSVIFVFRYSTNAAKIFEIPAGLLNSFSPVREYFYLNTNYNGYCQVAVTSNTQFAIQQETGLPLTLYIYGVG